jgi:hypothetical protein
MDFQRLSDRIDSLHDTIINQNDTIYSLHDTVTGLLDTVTGQNVRIQTLEGQEAERQTVLLRYETADRLGQGMAFYPFAEAVHSSCHVLSSERLFIFCPTPRVIEHYPGVQPETQVSYVSSRECTSINSLMQRPSTSFVLSLVSF